MSWPSGDQEYPVTGWRDIQAALSDARLEPYARVVGGDLQAAIELYVWNTSVSAAFYESLAHLEVGLRNAIDERLCALTGRADWWTAQSSRLSPAALDMLAKARRSVGQRGHGQPGDVVAALPFGFWVGLVSAGGGRNYENRLWRPAIRQAFPHYRGPRQPVHERLETLRLLRNRIAHHEPIHGRHLAADYANLLTVAGWLSPSIADWIAATTRIPDALDARP